MESILRSKAVKQLQGHRWLRSTSSWVIRHTNSKTVSAWLFIDLLISLGLGFYFFFFRYVSSLGLNGLSMMNSFKFYLCIAGLRALCSIWGILSVLFRSVRQVKLFYTVFILNLFVAVWLMIPILSLSCRCDSYYQCQALQSFALDGGSLNKWPEPSNFDDRKVAYEEEPSTARPLIDHPAMSMTITSTSKPMLEKSQTQGTKTGTETAEKKQENPQTEAAEKKQENPQTQGTNPEAAEKQQAQAPAGAGAVGTGATVGKATEGGALQTAETVPETPKVQEPPTNVAAAKDLAERTQEQVQPALIQRDEVAHSKPLEVSHDHSDLSLDDLISMGPRLVSKRRQRKTAQPRAEASLLQIDSSSGVEENPETQEAPKEAAKEDPKEAAKEDPKEAVPKEKKDSDVEEESKEALKIQTEKELKVLTYFNPVGHSVKLVSEHGDEGQLCEEKKKDPADWKGDLHRMDEMMEGRNPQEHDPSFIATIHNCMAEEACAGIFWKVYQEEENKTYESRACTIIGPVSMPNKEKEDMSDGLRNQFFLKNGAVVKELVANSERKAKLISKIFDAKDDDELVEATHRLYTNMCRCDEKSCRSYRQSQGSEMGWCYIDNKTRHLCTAAEKQIFLDDKDRPWTRSICHQAESYDLSCKCSGMGMLPEESLAVDKDLLKKNPYDYGSYCQKWSGEETKFKWCYVGWDSPCVDRRKSDQHHLYKDVTRTVPPQYWSEIACDQQEPNKRLMGAADLCENLEYTVDGVCLVHLFLSVPMIMVLYNYISNQCGDDIQTVQQFDVASSSDEDEFPAGQGGRKSAESIAKAASPAGPPSFEGAAATESH